MQFLLTLPNKVDILLPRDILHPSTYPPISAFASPSAECSKDEALAWKLQMEEQYYQDLLHHREGEGDEDSLVLVEEQENDEDLFDVSEEGFVFEDAPRGARPISLPEFDDEEDDEEEEDEDVIYLSDDDPYSDQVFESYEELLQLDEIAPPVSRGVNDVQLSSMASFVMDADTVKEHDQCHVCLESLEEGDECRLLGCKHAYHLACIDQWLRINKICPLCRVEVISSPQ